MVRGPRVVHGPNIDLVGTLLNHLRLELLLVREAEVPEVDVVLESKGELSVSHVVLVNIPILHPSSVTSYKIQC